VRIDAQLSSDAPQHRRFITSTVKAASPLSAGYFGNTVDLYMIHTASLAHTIARNAAR